MTERSLQGTYRKGKPFSTYLHLSHQTGEKSAKTVPSADGLLVVDCAKNGKPIGVDITAPTAVPLDRLNRLLADLGETLRPLLHAARVKLLLLAAPAARRTQHLTNRFAAARLRCATSIEGSCRKLAMNAPTAT